MRDRADHRHGEPSRTRGLAAREAAVVRSAAARADSSGSPDATFASRQASLLSVT